MSTMAAWYQRQLRRFSLAALARANPQQLITRGERRVLAAFRRAAATVPAYRMLLSEHGVEERGIRGLEDFQRRCPVLGKHNTFARFPLEALCRPGSLESLASVLTSSGHGARFAYGLSTWRQARRASDDIDLGLQYAFGVDDRKTLLINCLPMGVRFSSNAVTVAETSVREDMALGIATEIGRYFEQIILVGDPLFLKCLVDYASDRNVDWGAHRVHLVIGEETFGEHFRGYLAAQFKIDPDDPGGGLILSSMGVAELGLNLFYETRATVSLRRRAHADPGFFEALFGLPAGRHPLPMLFVYNPLRTHIETLDKDDMGYGLLTVSMTDRHAPLPLLRYQTGDVARRLAPQAIAEACARIGQPVPDGLTLPVIAVLGRDCDRLADESHVGQYKDALYAHREIADLLTGAFRLEFAGGERLIHIQLRRGPDLDARQVEDMRERLGAALPAQPRPDQVRPWRYEEFPFGMTLDYERKFTYFDAL